jgi:ferredoxin
MVCLETGESIPAYPEEIQQALVEGIVIEEGWGPHSITPTGIVLTRCLSLFDETGKFNPCLNEKESRVLDADTLIFAIGQAPDLSSVPRGLKVNKNGTIQVDPITGQTTLPGVFAGGDIVSGASTVISSIEAGKRAAVSIDRYLRSEDMVTGRDVVFEQVKKPPKEEIAKLMRLEKSVLSLDERVKNFREVTAGFDEAMACEESLRCMTCGSRAVINPVEECRLCQACERNCPQKAVSLQPAKTADPYIRITDTWEEIAQWMGVDPDSLKLTIAEYNSVCEKGYDPVFKKDRRYLVPLQTPPYYTIKMGVDYLDTIGGIRINERMEVLDKKGVPIPGVYAAGVDTGGWVGDTYCIRTTGTTFGFAINSGRIAGESAVKKIYEEKK